MKSGRSPVPLPTAELSLVLVTIIAAIGWVLSKSALQEFEPFTFLALRFVLAGLALAVPGWSQLRNLTLQQGFRSVATGSVMGAALLVWIVALQATDNVGVGAFIISLNVVAVPIIGRLLFGAVVPSGMMLALVPALVGLALLALGNGLVLAPGQGLFVIAMLALSLHLNLSSTYVQQVPALALSVVQLLTTGFIAGVAALLSENWTPDLSSTAWLILLVSSLFATSLRFAIQNRMLQKVSASHASMIFLAEPVWTALLSALLLAERMSGQQMLGCLLILLALLVYRARVFKSVWRYFR